MHGSTTITPLASFNGTNGANPFAGLVLDSSGDLFGTTEDGGAAGEGNVFEIVHGGTSINSLASFNGTNGGYPVGNLVLDSSGNLFGTTQGGGASNHGTVFELVHGSSSITSLASFTGSNGINPVGGLVRDSSGDLFGTTSGGGTSNDGTVFEIMHGTTSITTVASFNGSNGNYPYASMVLDSSGNLFGTTIDGGASSDGTVFEVAHGSTSITLLASFTGTNGNQPYAGLLQDSSGNLFGTTKTGGSSNDGIVFEIVHGTTSIIPLASFSGTNGANPYAGLVFNSSGALLGTTLAGGTSSDGTVFEILPATSTTLSSSVNPSVTGQSVTFTATVTASSATPTGTVAFYDGTTTLGTGTLNGSGVATYSTAALGVATHSITASYGGSSSLAPSTSSAVSQVVNKAGTATALTSSTNPSLWGQSVTFSATVTATTPGGGTPGGTVTFYNGASSIGTGTLNGSGVASFSTSTLPVAGDSITATYGGSSSYSTSTSSALTQTVNQDATSTSLSSGTNPSLHDSSVTFTATVSLSGTGSGTPGGSVELLDGTTNLGTATLSSGSATFHIANLSVGTNSLTAEYLGATDYATSTSTAVLQVVQANTLSVSVNSVSATAGTSTGTLTAGTFTDNDPTLTSPSNFTATISWGDGSSSTGSITSGSGSTFNVSGSHTYVSYGSYTTSVSVTDTYNSLTTFATNTATVANPVSLTNPGTQTKTEGATVSLAIAHTPSSGLSFSATGLPAGLGINPTTGVIAGTIALGDASSGPYTTIVTATYGNYTTSLSFAWNISTPITWNSTISNQASTEGAAISLTTGATDSVSGSTLTYGAVGLPNGLKINTSTGSITGTIAAGAAVNGPYTVTLVASDSTYSINQTFTWAVTNPISITSVSDQANIEGATPSLLISATDATTGKTLVFTADGLPNGLKINASTGAITGTIAAGAAENGPYAVTVTAGDGTSSADVSFTWTITSPVVLTVPADQTNNEGDTPSLTIVASDSTGGTVTFGAVNLPAGLSINSSTGAISGTVASGASAASPYTVTLFASDGTYADHETFNWTIGVNNPITITTPAEQSNNTGDTLSLAMAATDTGGTISSWSATGLPTGLSIDSSSGLISGTVNTGGTWFTTVTASDGSHSASETFGWYVSSSITILDSGNQVYNAGDSVSVSIIAADTSSSTFVYSATGLLTGLSINSSSGTISGTLSSSLASGNYTTTVSVTDGTNP